MRVTLGKNTISLKAQRELSEGAAALGQTTERLASGQRINRASDDPAGLALASSLKASSRVYGQAIRNINDGLSRLNVASGAVSELISVVARIQELAQQSANGALSSNQRGALDREAQALRDEFNRIANSTTFNDVRLLDGSSPSFDVQVGLSSDANARIQVVTGGALDRLIGDGTFTLNQNVAQVGRQVDTALVDFTGDGVLDILSMADSGGSLAMSRRNGNGTFAAAVSLTTTSSGSFVAADFTGDGRPDVVRSRFDGVRLETNVGGASMTGATISALTGTVNGGDFNNDGREDFIARDSAVGSSIHLFLSNGNGTFAAPQTITTAPATTITSVAADFNGDGNVDILAAGSFYFNLHLGNGNGTFATPSTITVPSGTISSATAGDFNGDGYLDAAFASPNGTSRVMLGNGDGTFGSTTLLASGVNLRSITAVDLNEDGRDDLIAGTSTGQLSVFTAQADGTFSARASFAGPTATSVQGVSFGDINNDGAIDVVGATYNGNSVGVWLGNGSPTAQLYNFSLLTREDSLAALGRMTDALNELSQTQASIGMNQSRMLAALSNVEAVRSSVLEATSRITDIDAAEEAANLFRQSIRQQVTGAILAQANQQSQIVRKLLRS